MYLGPVISIVFIIIVAYLLIKKYYPHAVLLTAGMLMLVIANYLPGHNPFPKSSGFVGFDAFVAIKDSFVKTNTDVGLMIMAIGGFVAYIDKIGASTSLVYLAMKPLRLFRKYPYIAASLTIPIGQVLFVCIPSAAGLGLLLMASVFPILVNLGVSRLSAVSVITASTALCLGPASPTTVSSTSILQMDPISYFVRYQIPLVIPLTIVMMVVYYLVNRYFDKKEGLVEKEGHSENIQLTAPLYYAFIPVLPMILLILFSDIFDFLGVKISIGTTAAMFVSLFTAIILEAIRKRSVKEAFKTMSVFWSGMGDIFKTVVTLIIAADIFAQGLIHLGFIDGLIDLTQHLGFGAVGIGVVMAVMIFLAAMLMGSGNAAFFAFGPLIPDLAGRLGIKTVSILLPMQFSATLGRTVSPVSGILIASAEVAKVPVMDLVKRNIIPVVVTLIIMLIYQFI